ncbi:uncharacterized protein METZ01_LOCUS52251, partial [marine metagenome]
MERCAVGVAACAGDYGVQGLHL